VQPRESTSVSRRGICDRAIWRKPLARRTRSSYGFCLGDSKIVRLWEYESTVVSKDSLGLGQQQRVPGRGLETDVSGWSRAMREDKDTEAIGVDDSVRESGLGSSLGGIKSSPLVQKFGSVPSGKRFHAEHGGGTLRTTEACGETGSVGSWGRGLGLVQQ
jgi:hypothetical protein